ncbi:MAG: NAD(P) transhydrogenase subunit alpha [candidate division NC10 bacterium]|nr:NAD(P) transhydrogenase subunit alpha [candidate division NC10 bacterium]
MEVLVSALAIFVLAMFVDFEVISKLPTLLHAPLAYTCLAACSGFLRLFAVLLPKELHP